MKLTFIISVCVVILCARESDGLKLLQKLKNILHPTTSTTIRPTAPAYENKNCQNSDEDSSMSQSQENQEGSFPENKYSSVAHNKRKPCNREETNYLGNLKTTTKSYDDIGYQTDKDYGTYNTISTTTTEISFGGSYSSKSPTSSGDFPNNDVTSSTSKNALDTWIESGLFDPRTTTLTPGGSVNQNNYDKLPSIGGADNGNVRSTTSRSDYNFNENNNTPNQYGDIDDIASTTQRVSQGTLDTFDYFSQSTTERNSYQNNYDKSSTVGGSRNGNVRSTTSRSDYNFNENNNVPNQYGSVDDIASTTQRVSQGTLDTIDYLSQSTTERNSYDSQGQSYGQSSIYGNGGIDTTQSTTAKNSYIDDFGETSDNSPSSGNFGNENPSNTFSNNKPEPPTYNYFTTKPTPTYDTKDLTNVQPGGGSNNTDSFGSSSSGKDEKYNNPSGSNPTYSETQGSNKKKIEGSDGGAIIFPEDTSIDWNERNERKFGESKTYHSSNKKPRVRTDVSAPVPVPDGGGKAIINAPSSLSSRKPS